MSVSVLGTMSTKPKPNPTADTAAADYLPPKAMAKRLGLSTKTLSRWASAGHVHPRKVGRKLVLFSVPEVLAFVEGCKV